MLSVCRAASEAAASAARGRADGPIAGRAHHQRRRGPRGAREDPRPAEGPPRRRGGRRRRPRSRGDPRRRRDRADRASGRRRSRPDDGSRDPSSAEPGADLVDGGPAYEVMYLLDAPDETIAQLRSTLAGLGDSLVVVGGEGLWNVHVHVDDVGSAIEAGIEAGRPHRVRVTHFAEQIAAREPRQRVGRAIVAVAAGPGLAGLFEEAGAVVVRGGPGNRPSTGMLLEAMVRSGAQEVVVLPNDNDSVRAAQVAASTAEKDHDMRVAVIPTTAQVQGLAALAVHEPGRTFDQDVLEMTATARHARQGAVTVAAKQAITMAGPCEAGDVLGAIGGDFVVVGHDLTEVAEDVLGRLLGGGGEMVTLVSGADDADGALAATCAGMAGGDSTPLSTSWCTTEARSATRSSSPSSSRAAGGSVDRPRLTRRVGARRGQGQEGPVALRGHHRAAGPPDRRRPAAPLPAPLPGDGLADLARGAPGGPAAHRGRRDLELARAGPTATGVPAGWPTGRRSCSAPRARRCRCPSSPSRPTSAGATSSGSARGVAASSWARSAPSAASGS